MVPYNISFVKYCKKRLRNSLITGIPKLANTTNPRRKSFKLIVFFMSIVGFLWQTYTFIKIYLEYPVVQHITTEHPEVFSAPAITLCNQNRLKRQLFCRSLTHVCSYNGIRYPFDFGPYAWDSLCKSTKKKKYCMSVKPENYELKLVPWGDRRTQNQSNEFLEALGPQSQRDLVEKCTIERSAKSIMCNDSIMIQVPKDGLPYKCFTFFSLIGEPNKDPENLSLSDYYSFQLNLHPEEDIDSLITAGAVYVSVHDSRRLKNPFAENMALEPGYSYRFYVTMEHRQSLPPPYGTNCADYIAMWKKNGGRGRLSKTDCVQVCMMKKMLEFLGCVLKGIEYPHNFPLCPTRQALKLNKLMARCAYNCPEGCDVTEYSVTYEVIDNLKDKLCNETDLHCKLSYVNLEINFNRMTVKRLKSDPMFESEELFSHIGGYIGLWLGISLITLFDLFEMIMDIIMYPLIKWRRVKIRTMSCTNDKYNE